MEAPAFRVASASMRILLWHGYLLGGTGSNVYSRALAREWSRGGHDVVVVSQERAPEQYDLGGAQDGCRRSSGRPAARVRHGPLRGARSEVPPGLHRGRATRVRRCERGCASRAAAGRPRVRQPRADGRARRSGERRAVSRQGTRLRARVLDARAPRAGRVGERNSRARGRDLRRLGAHSRGARRRGRHT